ncbi:MAG: endoglucanase [Methylobacterium mesophilicum]|nr:endoglucanase [Methylobacterium mesophilicum]
MALGAMVLLGGLASASAQSAVAPADWAAYKAKFLDGSGRIVDDANGNISHSEGQGYGMLLAYLAGARADFDLIWSFTKTELLLRDDGLAAWKWEPDATPHVTDPNNATDGDMLIAYALGLAGESWRRPDLLAAGQGIAEAIGRAALLRDKSQVLLMPAATGFGAKDRADGPVINISYWVFEAFPVLSNLAPNVDWQALRSAGLGLARDIKLGNAQMPPDWLSLDGEPKAAEGFPAEFGYNAIRIPLYLMRAGIDDRATLEPLLKGMSDGQGNPRTVLLSNVTKDVLRDPGYRMILAMGACVLDKTPIPDDLKTFRPTNYYPSTLQLLALSFVARRHGDCL